MVTDPPEYCHVRWKKSSHSSDSANCVEVALSHGSVIRVRDSKDPAGPALSYSTESWNTFISAVRLGTFDHPAH
jgi:Domain of unknown function (DUF397)